MSEHHPGDEQHRRESELLHAQEHKGYGDDEGEREQLLDRDDDAPGADPEDTNNQAN